MLKSGEQKKAYDKKYRSDNRAHTRETRRIWYSKNRCRFRLWNWKYRYGISAIDYQRMYGEQNGCCAICGKPCVSLLADENGQYSQDRAMTVDHDHKSKTIRGLLCTFCNIGLGRFRDDPDILQKAIEYLRKRNVQYQ